MSSHMNSDARTTRSTGIAARPRPAFTIIELLVSILVISILIAILIVAVNAALNSARRGGEQQTVAGLQQGVGIFQNTFDNRLPPLVWDGDPISLVSSSAAPRITGAPTVGPVDPPSNPAPPPGAARRIATYESIYQDGGAVVLTGREPNAGGAPSPLFDPLQDPRYSKFSLPIFLGGLLSENADGVAGPGLRLTYTNREGWLMGGQSQVREPLFAMSNERGVQASYISLDEHREHGINALHPGDEAADPDKTAYVNGEGVAIRYYRWAQTDAAADAAQSLPANSFLNLPLILRDPRYWNDPDEPGPRISAELRSAKYALVSAGPNGVFGTEPIALLRERLGTGANVAEDMVRHEAWDDNVVRLGQ